MSETPLPRQVYTVGDRLRLLVEFVSEANVEDVEVVFEREGSYSEGDTPQSTVSLEGTVEESEVIDERPYHLPRKRFSATLVSLVDRDHLPGSYGLRQLLLRTAGGVPIPVYGSGDQYIRWERFRIVPEPTTVADIKVSVEPREDT